MWLKFEIKKTEETTTGAATASFLSCSRLRHLLYVVYKPVKKSTNTQYEVHSERSYEPYARQRPEKVRYVTDTTYERKKTL
jgi:hypothetical protein